MKKVIVILVCVLVVASGIGLIGYRFYQSSISAPVQAPVEENAEIPVHIQQPARGDMSVTSEFIGKVKPGELVSVYPKTAGTVLTVYAEVGDEVKQGDLLYEIDPEDIQLQVDAAEASYETTRLTVEQMLGSTMQSQNIQSENSYYSALNAYESAFESLQDYRDTDRASALEDTRDILYDTMRSARSAYNDLRQQVRELENQLVSIGSSSGLEQKLKALKEQESAALEAYSTANAAYEQAVSANSSYDSGLTQLENALESAYLAMQTADELYRINNEMAIPEATAVANAQLRQAKLAYDSALKSLEDTKVYAPIDGVVEQCNVEEHAQSYQQGAAYMISNKDMLTVTFNVAPGSIDQMEVGDTIEVENNGEVYEGTIIEIASMVDEQSGLFPVKASISASSNLPTGLTVKIRATTQKSEDTITVPLSVVYYEDNQPYVYVMEDGTAVKTPITTGIANTDSIEVLSGLSADSQVIASWHPSLIDGSKVTLAAEGE